MRSAEAKDVTEVVAVHAANQKKRKEKKKKEKEREEDLGLLRCSLRTLGCCYPKYTA